MQKNLVRMEGRELGETQAQGRVTARDLVKTSLRMRPDRIVMGEVRGAEAFDLMQAINTGHSGSMATIHANNPREAFGRLEQMISMAAMNLPAKYIRQQIASALDLVIQMHRDDHGRRRISHITEIIGLEGEILITQDLFAYKEAVKGEEPVYLWSNLTSRNKRVTQAVIESRRFAETQAGLTM